MPSGYMSPKTAKRSARFTQFGARAALEAIRRRRPAREGDARREHRDRGRAAGIGGFDVRARARGRSSRAGPGKFAPLTVPMIIPNMAAGMIADARPAAAARTSASRPRAPPARTAIGTALDLIRTGRCDVAIAGGAEARSRRSRVDGYCQLRALVDPQRRARDAPRGRSAPTATAS